MVASKQDRPYVAVSRNGELLPETKAVIAMIAKYNLVMATGHNSPEDDLLLIREARKQGVTHIVVTHAMMTPIHMTIPADAGSRMRLGAYLEFVYNGLTGVKGIRLCRLCQGHSRRRRRTLHLVFRHGPARAIPFIPMVCNYSLMACGSRDSLRAISIKCLK